MPIRLKSIPVVLFLFSVSTALSQSAHRSSAGAILERHYNAAQHLQQAGKLDEAASQYRIFLASAQSALAIAHANIGEYTRAASLFDEAIRLTPDSSDTVLLYAKTALASGDLQHTETLARNYLREFPANRPGQAEAHQLLGRALLKLNRNAEARKELESAVALDPTFENGYDLAVVCLDLDDGDCAAHMFAEMEASFGDRPEVHMHFGRAYADSDFAPRAVTEFQKVIAEDPRYPGVHYALAAALMTGSEDEAHVLGAERELKKELAISPGDFLTYAALGKIAAHHQQYAAAEGYLQKATQLNPMSPDAFLYLGQMYYDTERIPEAEGALHKAIQLTTDVSRNRYQIQKAHFLLGRILMREHKPTEAHAEMEIARGFANQGLSQDKSKLAGLLDRGHSADEASSSPQPAETSSVHDPREVQKAAGFERQLTGPIADSYNNLGAIAAGSGNYAEALTSFERAAEWNPALDGLDLNWGRAAFMASHFAEAVQPLARYLRSHPSDYGVRTALGLSQYMTHDYTGCEGTLEPITDKIASLPQAQFVYADSLVKTGRVARGRLLLQNLERTNPNIAEVHRGVGEALALEGKSDQAAREFENAIRLNARDPEAHYDLGKLKLAGGDASQAISELQSAIQLLRTEPQFHRALSAAYAQAMRPADAAKETRIYQDLLAQSEPAPASGVKP